MSKFPVYLLVLGLVAAAPVLADSKIEPAEVIRTVAPVYPENLKDQQIMGVVVVDFIVDVRGNVTNASIEKSTNTQFEQPALDAVRHWKFKPARKDGVPVARKIFLPIKFQIES